MAHVGPRTDEKQDRSPERPMAPAGLLSGGPYLVSDRT